MGKKHTYRIEKVKKMWAWGWFSGKTAPPPEESSKSLGDTINESMDGIDALTAKRIQLLQRSHLALKEAREFNSQGNTARAMECMKKKQYYDQQAKVYDGMILNMEKASMAMESTATTVQVAKTMKEGTLGMKAILKQVNIDDVDTIADDLDDSMREANEMSNALSRPMGNVDPEEDDLILAEMEKWEIKEEEKVISLPDLPQKKPINEKKGVKE